MLWKLLLLSVFLQVHLAPMSKNEAMSYLKQYGYMTDSSNRDFHQAMTEFQEFMGLTLTGEMNDQTDKMMRMPRCGMPDMTLHKPRTKRYSLQGSRWRVKKITYKIEKYASTLAKSIINRELKEAFDIWSYYLKIKFIPKVYGRSIINVGFYKHSHGDVRSFDGPGKVLGHAFYPIFGGDIHFDDSENWTSQKETGINFKQVALHEIGHSLGLLHSRKTDAIMYPTYRRYVKDLQLNEDDIMGLRNLYSRYM